MTEENNEIADIPQDEALDAEPEAEAGAADEATVETGEVEPLAGELAEAEPPTEEAEPPTEEAEPPTEEAEPPTEEAEPPTEEAEPPTEDAEPPTEAAEPPTEDAEPPTEEAEPPTELQVEEVEPRTEETEPMMKEAEPPAGATAEPSTEEMDPPADGAEPLAEAAEAGQPTGDESATEVAEPTVDEATSHDTEQLPAECADVLQSSAIPSENHQEFYDAFCLISDGRSYIEGRDVRRLMLALGQDCSCEDSAQQLLEERGLDQDSQLAFEEAVAVVSSAYRPRAELTDDLMSSFRVFDRNGNGYLEYDELYRAMFQIGSQALEESAKEDFEHLIRLVDKNQDGRIDYSEFCQIVTMSVSELRRRLDDN